jgi:hypothetical protein
MQATAYIQVQGQDPSRPTFARDRRVPGSICWQIEICATGGGIAMPHLLHENRAQ